RRSSNLGPMSRFRLAFVCLFRLLFGKQLPTEAAAYLPALAAPERPPAPPPPAARPEPPSPQPRAFEGAAQARVEGALVLLGLLQREGRLVDFLREPLD